MVDNAGKQMLDVVQNIRHAVFIFVLLCNRRLLHKKNLAARLPEVWPISTFHMKQLEYLENVQRIALRPEKIFHERYIKVRMVSLIVITRKIDTCIKRKILLF